MAGLRSNKMVEEGGREMWSMARDIAKVESGLETVGRAVRRGRGRKRTCLGDVIRCIAKVKVELRRRARYKAWHR
jgi:hypothetical protein